MLNLGAGHRLDDGADDTALDAQRGAARRAGMSIDEVLVMDGRFVRSASGSYRLDVTQVRERGRGGHDG